MAYFRQDSNLRSSSFGTLTNAPLWPLGQVPLPSRSLGFSRSVCPSISRLHLWLRIRRHGVWSSLGPKQSEAIFSVNLNRQDSSGDSELLGPGSLLPHFLGSLSPSAESPMVGADVKLQLYVCLRWAKKWFHSQLGWFHSMWVRSARWLPRLTVMYSDRPDLFPFSCVYL
jgi:hypothetical protein